MFPAELLSFMPYYHITLANPGVQKRKGEGVEGEGGYCELFGLAPGAKNFKLMEILKIWRMVVVI